MIGRYGGTVEKFIGDAVMAVWGAPTAHEDDAERAVRAALELVDAVDALSGPGIQARAGVLTGEAAVTLGATNQGMVAGDLVNTAARLQSSRRPAPCSSARRRYRAAREAIAFEAAGEQMLKGKAAPVPAWRALRVVAERRRAQPVARRSRRRSSGRDDELRLLKELFHATGARSAGAPRVASSGRPASARRRLAWEFQKYLDGLVETIWWHRAGRPPTARASPSGRSARWSGARRAASRRTTRRRRATKVARRWSTTWCPTPRAALDRAALLAARRRARGVAIARAVRARGGRSSSGSPRRHRGDGLRGPPLGGPGHCSTSSTTSLEWSREPPDLHRDARPARSCSSERPDWGAGKRSFTAVYLEPLPRAAMRELLAGLVPGLPAAGGQGDRRPAEGVPLYAVEIVRMLVDDRRLAPTRRAPTPDAATSADLAVPETLTALIARAAGCARPSGPGLAAAMPRCWARASPRRASRR